MNMMVTMRPVIIWEDPIRSEPSVVFVPDGLTLAEMRDQLPLHNDKIRPFLTAYVEAREVPEEYLAQIKPKYKIGNRVIAVAFGIQLAGGGGGGGGKKILGAIAAIALLGVSLFGGQIGAVLGLGKVGTKILVGALVMGANFLLQGLAPEPDEDKPPKPLGFAGATNDFQPGSRLQRVIGTDRIRPKLVVPPYTEFLGDDQWVYAVYALDGPHEAITIRLGDTEVDNIPGLEFELRTGLSTDEHLTLVTDTRIEKADPIELDRWKTETDDDERGFIILEGTIEQSEPQESGIETKGEPDEFHMEFFASSGLVYQDETDQDRTGIYLRIRFKKFGEDEYSWVYLPDIAMVGKQSSKGIRGTLKIIWVDEYPTSDISNPWEPDSKKIQGWAELNNTIVGADLAHSDGSGGYTEWHYSKEALTLYLLKSEYPQDRYQFQILRSWPMVWGSWNESTKVYTWGGGTTSNVFAPVTSSGDNGLPKNPQYFSDNLTLERYRNVWYEYPIADDDEYPWLLAIKLKNRQLQDVNVVISGLYDDWNGASWVALQATSNPASALREVLMGDFNAQPVDETLIDMAELEDWHEENTENGHTSNFVAEGRTVADLVRAISLCGFAAPRMGAKYGVIPDRLRDTPPSGLISQRNATKFRFNKPLPLKVHAIRALYRDAEREYEEREIMVYASGFNRDGSEGLIKASRIESYTYEGLTNEAIVIERAEFDLRWMQYRNRTISCTQDIEHLEHKRGSLVMVETDILGQQSGRGRVLSVTISSIGVSELRASTNLRTTRNLRRMQAGESVITELLIDERPLFGLADINLRLMEDLRSASNLRLVAAARGATIRHGDGSLTTHEVSSFDIDGRIVFADPILSDVKYGDLVVTGPLSSTCRPMVIQDLVPQQELTAELTFVNYAADNMYVLPRPVIRSIILIPGFNDLRIAVRAPDHSQVTSLKLYRALASETFYDAIEVEEQAADPSETVIFFDSPPSTAIWSYWATVIISATESRESERKLKIYQFVEMFAVDGSGTLLDLGDGNALEV